MSHTTWESEELLRDGDHWFEAVLDSVARAEKFVYLESYIFDDDRVGKRLADALIKASLRGVRVFVLVDGIGAPHFAKKDLHKFAHSGIEARIYHPPPWILSVPWFEGFHRLRLLFMLVGRMNKRNHRKVLIVDGREMIAGSMNVAECHFREFVGSKAWHDSAVRVRGEREIRYAMTAFERAWEQAWRRQDKTGIAKTSIKGETPHLLRFNFTQKLRRKAFKNLLHRVRGARERIWITNAYFVPRGRFLAALKDAAKRGVDIRVIVPSVSDVPIVKRVTELYYPEMLAAGVKIHEYLPSILHSKTMIVDQWAIVGSSNLNHRSFLHDLEVDVVLSSARSRDAIGVRFLKDLEACSVVTPERARPFTLWGFVLARIGWTIRNWL